VTRVEEGWCTFKISTGKSTERPLGRSKGTWAANSRTDIKEIDISMRNWVDSAQDRNYLESPCECDIELPGSDLVVNIFL
jgi:hypothetical protein